MTDSVKELLEKYNIPFSILERYNEPHRHYHNWDHIESMLRGIEDDHLRLAIIFHDIIYDPMRTDNEEMSAKLLFSFYPNEEVFKAICETKTHKASSSLSQKLCNLDLEILNAEESTFLSFEKKIFKEYQFVDYATYKRERFKILKELGTPGRNLRRMVDYEPNIGVFSGSFNPWHKGHQNVLEQAEKIFDKVIILQGQNPKKETPSYDLRAYLPYHQIVKWEGLTTDYIGGLEYPVTLIKGLRDSSDFDNEQEQLYFMKKLNPNLNTVFIICDHDYRYYSSTNIKILESYGKVL